MTGPRVTFSVSAYWLIRGDHVTEIHQTCVPVKGSAPGLTIASFTFLGFGHTFFIPAAVGDLSLNIWEHGNVERLGC